MSNTQESVSLLNGPPDRSMFPQGITEDGSWLADEIDETTLRTLIDHQIAEARQKGAEPNRGGLFRLRPQR